MQARDVGIWAGVATAVAAATTAAVTLWRARRERRQDHHTSEERGQSRRREQASKDVGPLAALQRALPGLRECARAAALETSPEARRRQLEKCAGDVRSAAGSTRHRDVRQAVELAANRCEAWVAVETQATIAGYLRECEDTIRAADALIRARLQELHDIASGELD